MNSTQLAYDLTAMKLLLVLALVAAVFYPLSANAVCEDDKGEWSSLFT